MNFNKLATFQVASEKGF